MDKQTKEKLRKTIEISEQLLAGEPVKLTQTDKVCIPAFLDVMTPTTARKRGLKLKQRAKSIGKMDFYIVGHRWVTGDLYLGRSFKNGMGR